MRLGISLSLTQPLGGFSPASLFSGGQQGAWYDPSDLNTLFQDAAGTTPVTAAGQPVGLVLDKSKGLVLGPELVTNGTFDTDTGWTKGAGWTISGGVASRTNVSAISGLSQTVTATQGKFYQITIDVVVTGGSIIGIRLGSTSQITTTITTSGTYTYRVACDGTNNTLNIVAQTNFSGTVDNISVRELPGNHATQATAASRPTYGVVPATGRRNLLTYTEQFDNAAWTAGAVNLTSLAAGRITPNTTIGQHRYDRTTTIAAGVHTFSIEVKADGYSFLWIRLGAISAVFNATTGSATSVTAGATANFVSADEGYIRITLSGTAAGNDTLRIGALPSTSTADFAGDGTSGILIRKAQLETGSSATAYQRVGSAFDVTEAGVASLSYLSFDGWDDFLVTPTITPNIDKAQVFAGVRVIGSSAGNFIVETSTDLAANNGTVHLIVPNNSPFGGRGFRSKGTIAAVADTANNAYTAPISQVLSGLGDISGDLATLRVNGTQAAQSTADQGTGNFLAYPLYIGRRGGTTLPFNGNLFSLIVRFGANLDANTISNTETWVNGKTGAY